MTRTNLPRFHFVHLALIVYISLTLLEPNSSIDVLDNHTAQPPLLVSNQSLATTEGQRNVCCGLADYFDVGAQKTTFKGFTRGLEATSRNLYRDTSRHNNSSVEDYVLLRSENLTECFGQGQYLVLVASAGEIRFGDVERDTTENADERKGSGEDTNTTKVRTEHGDTSEEAARRKRSSDKALLQGTCLVKVSAPAGKVWKLTLELCSGFSLQVSESDEAEHKSDIEKRDIYHPHNETQIHDFPRENQTRESYQENRKLLAIGCYAWSPPSDVFSRGDTVWLALGVKLNDTRTPAFHLRFAAVSESQALQLQLQLVFTSPLTGYLQTPNWDGRTKYSPLMRSCVTLTAPEGHVIFLSFVSMAVKGRECDSDPSTRYDSEYLALYSGPCWRSSDLVWKHCTMQRPAPYLHPNPSGSISLYFVSSRTSSSRTSSSRRQEQPAGFRAQFSFHNHTAPPEQLPDGTWNCSVKHWLDFQQHFPCDLVPQCARGEDEARCPYTSDRCGPGNIDVGGRCYNYVTPRVAIPWNDASYACSSRGTILASLESPQEWDDVIGLLHQSDFNLIYVGLKTTASSLPVMYRKTWQWLSGHVAFHLDIGGMGIIPVCAALMSEQFKYQRRGRSIGNSFVLRVTKCAKRLEASYLCELPSVSSSRHPTETLKDPTPSRLSVEQSARVVTCPKGYVTHTFMACDADSACWASSSSASDCAASLTPLPPMFECAQGAEAVPYTLVCDYRSDCRDSSDESFCDYPPCSGITLLPCGNSGQCFAREVLCDGEEDCASGSDEDCCYIKRLTLINTKNPPPPGVVVFDYLGRFRVESLPSAGCPRSHFQCPGNGYCLPVHVRCNGVLDCPGREDEAACDSYTCPGFYRCRGSRVCLDVEGLCDGVVVCPQHDDELACGLDCPDQCTCYGLAFFCPSPFPAGDHGSLRFLQARGSGLSLSDLDNNTMLVHLGLGACRLQQLTDVQLVRLHSLDLSDNLLRVISMHHLQRLSHLRSLNLAGNPLNDILLGDVVHFSPPLRVLDLSQTSLRSADLGTVGILTDLLDLNFSHSGLGTLRGLEHLRNIRVLDMRGCGVVEIPPDVLCGMQALELVYADNPKLCCQDILPAGFNLKNCLAPADEISSCDDLLRSDLYRVVLTVFAVLALLGNLTSFVYRLRLHPSVRKLGFHVFVTQLCVSDFLMGVYLAIIGVADRVYMGRYLWEDVAWKNSIGCQVAGFLSLLSSETSAFTICLITVERFIVIRFPFSRLHFKGTSAYLAVAVAWILGLMLAALPLLPAMAHWRFYSQTGICIPLPITRADFPGHGYSFSVLIVCNLVLFLLIAVGQGLIYWSVLSGSMSDTNAKAKDAVIARRLLTVVMSDFLCWFPIGLCGVLSSSGWPVPGEVNVVMAIFVLPLNSALNPFLYTLNVVLEKRQKLQEERVRKFLLSEIKAGGSVIKERGMRHR